MQAIQATRATAGAKVYRTSRGASRIAAALGVAIVLGSPAGHSQEFEHVITFGDSLSDTGNVHALLSSIADDIPVLSPKPESPPHFAGRFSNGPVWAEILATALTGRGMNNLYDGIALQRPPAKRLNPAVGNVNTAVGGSRADGKGSFEPLNFGFPRQISDFERAGGAIGAADLVTIWGGANDIVREIDAGRDAARAAVAAAAAQAGNVDRLINDLGARTLLVPNMLPPPLQTPVFPLTTFPTEEYNEALDARLESLAAANPDVNIVQADVTSMFQVIDAHPEAFGFTIMDAPCAGGNFVSGVVGVCSNPEQHFLWHSVHPGAQGHRYIALYAALLLSTPGNARTVAPLAESALYARLAASRAALERTLDAVAFSRRQPGASIQVISDRLEGDGGASVPAYRQDRLGLRGGITNRLGPGVAGASVALVQGDHEQEHLSATVRTLEGDVHGAVQRAPFFAGVAAGLSYTDFDNVRRDTGFGRFDPIPPEHIRGAPLVADAPVVFADSDTSGWSYSAAAAAGVVVQLGRLKLVPNARVGYLETETDAFDEVAPILALGFAGREISSAYWSAALRAVAEIGSRRHPLITTAEVGYEALFATRTDDVMARLVDNTAAPVSIGVDQPVSPGLYLELGVGGHLQPDAILSANLGLSLRDGRVESHRASVELEFLFGD